MNRIKIPEPPRRPDVPLYGTIPYLGGEWTVYFRPGGPWHTYSQSGSGEFPRQEYPDIPVVDYRSRTCYECLFVAEAGHTSDACHRVGKVMPLAEYLAYLRGKGITIIAPGEPVPATP